ncbi:MAG: hypothetical protein V1816_21625, partial [Pseudomonadota bacterium]
PRQGPQNSKRWCAWRTLQTPGVYMLQLLYKQIKFLLDGLRRSFAGFLALEIQRPRPARGPARFRRPLFFRNYGLIPVLRLEFVEKVYILK